MKSQNIVSRAILFVLMAIFYLAALYIAVYGVQTMSKPTESPLSNNSLTAGIGNMLSDVSKTMNTTQATVMFVCAMLFLITGTICLCAALVIDAISKQTMATANAGIMAANPQVVNSSALYQRPAMQATPDPYANTYDTTHAPDMHEAVLSPTGSASHAHLQDHNSNSLYQPATGNDGETSSETLTEAEMRTTEFKTTPLPKRP